MAENNYIPASIAEILPAGLISVGDDSHLDNMANFSVYANAKSAVNEVPKEGKPSAKYSIGNEMRVLYKNNMNYDDKPVKDIVLSAAKIGGVDASLLFASAFGEGMNKAIARPDDISEGYDTAVNTKQIDENVYPVDGYGNYGLDRFGDNYSRLKQYLPKGFEDKFKTFKATNEKGEKVNTAAFKSNEDALIAKSAMLKDTAQQVQDYAKQKDIKIDAAHLNYFTLAGYNGGIGNARIILDEYAKAKDKNDFIEGGKTTRGAIHKNIKGRLESMRVASQLLDEDIPVTNQVPLMETASSLPLKTT